MKHTNALSLATGLLACALPLATAWSADQQTPRLDSLPLTPALYPQDSQQEPQQQPDVKTFTGRISKDGQKFVLEDPAMNTSYQLDDQKKAQQHEGKNVRVTGTLDAQNNLIHVHAIEDAA
jgi:hypothetical protein